MTRNDFQELSRMRLREARALLQGGHFAGAYYLAGYSVECALKACIAKKVNRYDFPDKETTNKSYTHDLERLVEIAGLKTSLINQTENNRQFALNWATAKDWSEETRYDHNTTEIMAKNLYSAIAARQHGVMRWLRGQW